MPYRMGDVADQSSYDPGSWPGAGAGDPLLMPPVNPFAPPRAVENFVRGVAANSEIPSHSVLNWMVPLARHSADWAQLPGDYARGVQPETPGRWTEEDQFRENVLRDKARDWGVNTAYSDVFWPRAGGAGILTSGAGSRLTAKDFPSVFNISKEVPAGEAFRNAKGAYARGEVELRDVPINELIATQEGVARNFRQIAGKALQKEPVVLDIGGQLYVHDGHHRIMNAAAQGQKTIKAYVAKGALAGGMGLGLGEVARQDSYR